MATSLVQHPSPPHSGLNTVVSISTFSPEAELERPSLSEPVPEAHHSTSSQPRPGVEQPLPTSEMPDTDMADAPPTDPEPPPESDPSGGQRRQQTSTGAEEAQSRAQADTDADADAEGVPQPVSGEPESTTQDPILETRESPNEEIHIPPPPPPLVQEQQNQVPEWVTWEDDVTEPTPDEMIEIRLRETKGEGFSALDVPSVEKRVFSDVDDPDQRPIKKIRLSWVIKGVRGTRDKPNHARVMVSPPALVDGNYWQIKFYPRGNKCVNLSAYIKCSRQPPKSDVQVPNSAFSFFEGPPDSDLGNGAVPTLKIDTAAEEEHTTNLPLPTSSATQKQGSPEMPGETTPAPPEEDGNEQQETKIVQNSAEEDWRVSAQLGMIMYNPREPRVWIRNSSEHQFAKTNDDWGWTNFGGHWRDIHLRQHCCRSPLLQNDTIAIDAYIRIFEDPSQALWWHVSDAEPQWDSKALAGYYPMGTPPLYHSPAVAGMTALLLLAPFRKILQAVDAGEWRRNSQVRPRPLICHLQMILFLMRTLKKERETYVDVHPAIQAIRDMGEDYSDIKTFWEVFRRSIELEVEGDEKSLRDLGAIFDTPDGPLSLPPLPVENVLDVQQSLTKVLSEQRFNGQLPNFLPLTLARQRFDKNAREWKLLHDRVILNEELDVSDFSPEGQDAKYTLYGFMVHVGERSSGKFYTVLRPGGPSTKWLAFEDGDGNKVFSYTRKRIQDFEGLEGQQLRDLQSTRQTAYMVMYIRTSCLSQYLPGQLEPYKLPKWLMPSLESHYPEADGIFAEDAVTDDSEELKVEIYSDQGVIGRQGLLDMFNIKQQSQHNGLYYIMTSPKTATYQDLRQRLAQKLEIADPQTIRLFLMSYTGIGNYVSDQMRCVSLQSVVGGGRARGQPVCLWLSVLKTKDEIDLFGEPDRPKISEVAPELSQPGNENPHLEIPNNTTEEPLATPDVEQASVRAAVAADIALTSNEIERQTAEPERINDPDTPMQMEIPPSSAEASLPADVPHGHLIDAASHSDPVAVPGANGPPVVPDPTDVTLFPAEEAAIAAVIPTVFDGAEVMDFEMNSGSDESTDHSNSQSAVPSTPGTPPSEQNQAPVDNVYGFIQFFDLDNQNFRVHDTFFAKSDEKVLDFLRKRLGYAEDKEFHAWRRESLVTGATVGPDDTFRDPKFFIGAELVVYDVLSDSRAKELDREGKFFTPLELSQYLRMVDRRHPIASKTTTEPIEIAEFGTDYYKGHLVNGRFHGANSFCISSSGNVYEGPLVSNDKCGKGGKMTYQNGDTYDGEWDEDERHGQGTFVEARTGNKYVGGFEYGKRWGMGTTFWQVADEQADLCQICYSQEIDALFFDCGHVCSCVECARQCEICPICRKAVKQVVKMFRA